MVIAYLNSKFYCNMFSSCLDVFKYIFSLFDVNLHFTCIPFFLFKKMSIILTAVNYRGKMVLIKEYVIPVKPDDYIMNFAQSKHRVKRFIEEFFDRFGLFSFRVTLDVIMEKAGPDPKTQTAGFRSSLEPVRRSEDIESIVLTKFNKIDNSIDGYNLNGMSGCVLKEIVKLRVLVVKQRLY